MSESIKDRYEAVKGMSYLDRQQNYADAHMLNCLKSGSFKSFISTGISIELPKVDEAFSIGNVQYILKTIYRNYIAYPELEIDLHFENTLIQMLDANFFDFYAAMDAIKQHIEYEHFYRDGTPFTLKNTELFNALKRAIEKNWDYIDGKKYYAGQLYDDGLTGYVRELNDLIKKVKGYSIL